MKVIPMIDITQSYSDFCQKKGMPFSLDSKIKSYDETTLFCPAGMQQFKTQFKDQSIANVTQANIQSCLRLLDLDNIGDGTHFLYFNMIGLFSFRGMSVQEAVDFWMEYLSTLGLKPDYVTIHPDKPEWIALYNNYGVEVRADKECVWSDGELSGYCTELHKEGGYIDSVHFKLERERQENILQKYLKIKDRYPGKTKEWWFDTHGIDIDLVE